MKTRLFLLFAFAPILCTAQVRLFQDDQDGRNLAAIEALDTQNGEASLSIRIRADHPWVDPEQGWQPMRGMNRNTAYQLETLAAEAGRLTASAYDPTGRLVTEGRLVEIHRGDYRERVRLPDGSFLWNEVVEEDVVTQLVLRGGRLASGVYDTDLWAYGERRMRLKLEVVGGQARVLDARSLKHGDDRDPSRGTFPPEPTPIADETPYRLDEAAWKAKTLEAKWTHFQALKPSEQKPFVTAVLKAGDEAFVEELGIYHPGAFETLGVGMHLKNAQSDRWIRLAVWQHRTGLGHGPHISQVMLMDTNHTGEVRAWFAEHAEALRGNIVTNILVNLPKVDALPAVKGLPPIDAERVYEPWLDPNVKGTPAAFERSLRALTVRNQYREPYFSRFKKLIRTEPDPKRRQSILLTCAHIKAIHLPVDDIKAIARDRQEADEIRQAAVLGLRRLRSGYLYFSELALHPDQPTWDPAVSYLGDLGDAYTLKLLEELDELSKDQIKLREDTASQISARWKHAKQPADLHWSETSSMRANLLEATVSGSAIEEGLEQFFLDRERALRGTPHFDRLASLLERIASKDGPKQQASKNLLKALQAH